MKTAIVTGASSGIGRALAVRLAEEGFRLAVMARRTALLLELQKTLAVPVTVAASDLSNPAQALKDFQSLWDSLGDVDLVILNAGVSLPCRDFSWENDRAMINVNAAAFTALAQETVTRFLRQGQGHLAGISSIAGTRGSGKAPVYGATKAFVSNYLQGLRQQVRALCPAICITDVRPGFVDTVMIQSTPRKFWVASPEKAAAQILEAIRRRRRAVYVTRRWQVVAILFFLVPEAFLEWIYARFLKPA